MVGLVEHGDLDAAQVAGPLVDQVLQPARAGDHDVDAAAQGGDLVAVADAAEDRRRCAARPPWPAARRCGRPAGRVRGWAAGPGRAAGPACAGRRSAGRPAGWRRRWSCRSRSCRGRARPVPAERRRQGGGLDRERRRRAERGEHRQQRRSARRVRRTRGRRGGRAGSTAGSAGVDGERGGRARGRVDRRSCVGAGRRVVPGCWPEAGRLPVRSGRGRRRRCGQGGARRAGAPRPRPDRRRRRGWSEGAPALTAGPVRAGPCGRRPCVAGCRRADVRNARRPGPAPVDRTAGARK